MSSREIRIATRKSALALWQAEYVKARLEQAHPGILVTLVPMVSRGDKLLDSPLSKIGGKGLFVKELETALLDNEADIAVHSMKDVPVEFPDGLGLHTICEREDPRDAFVSNDYSSLADLPEGAVVGTSSLRREAQIRERYPHLEVKPLRGNLDTRLRKLDEGQYAAIILAAAGLKRLGLPERIKSYIEVNDSLPAAGQGALGIEILAERQDVHAILQALNDASTSACITAERAVSLALGGSCQVPLAAYATLSDEQLQIDALVATPDGKQVLRAQTRGPVEQAQQLGIAVAEQLKAAGGAAIIAEFLHV